MLDRAAFFAAVRKAPFAGPMKQGQVDGLNAILDAAPADLAAEPLAYCLATAFHETARTMRPIEEYGRGKGKSYGVPSAVTGQTYFGRGLVQLTWLANYDKAGRALGLDLVHRPELALQADVAAKIMFRGMVEGWFTGKKLADYFGPSRSDPVGARRIINGTDRASIIAGYHGAFLGALKASDSTAAPSAASASPAPSLWSRLFARKAA